jgi:rod shape-determining protein MreC
MNAFSDRRRRPLFPRGPGIGLRALLLIVLAASLLFWQRKDARLETAREWGSTLLQPIVSLAGVPRDIADIWTRYADLRHVEADNRVLRERQLVLEAQLQKMSALEAENGRLRGLLSSAADLQERVLIAEVLSISQDPYRHQIVISKGRSDGVYRGQALVDADGVLGQVIEVNANSAIALLITDPNHGIPVEFNRTGLQTIALGRGDGPGLSLPYLPGNADVRVGDLIVTSGLGGRFPAGYPVGVIHELRHNTGETFMEAIAYPSAHINEERQVLLVWSQSTPDDVATPPAAPTTSKPAPRK